MMNCPGTNPQKSSGEVQFKGGAPSEEVQATAENVEKQAKSPLDEVMSQAEKAYAAYMEAEREVAGLP